MADKKVTELSAITNLSGDDLLLVVNDPSGTPQSNKVTVTNLFANVVPNVLHKGTVTARANTTFTGTTMTVSSNATFSGTLTASIGKYLEVANSTATLVSNTNFQSYVANTNSQIATLVSNADFQSYVANTNAQLTSFVNTPDFQSYVANTNNRLVVLESSSNAVSKSSETEQVMSANLVVDAGATIATSGVHISNGQINIFSATGAPSLVDFYCEVTNAHKVRLQAPAHADFSGDVAVTLPIKSGNVATTNSETFVGTTSTENLSVGGSFRILTKSSDPATSNAANEGITAGSVFYSNTHLYVATDDNTIKRVALSTF